MTPTDEERAAYAAKYYAPSESDIEAHACSYAKELGCWQTKFKSPTNRGAPDRLMITPDGLVFFIEFKKRKKKAGPQQRLVIDDMKANNAKVFVCDTFQAAKAIICDMVTFGDAREVA